MLLSQKAAYPAFWLCFQSIHTVNNQENSLEQAVQPSRSSIHDVHAVSSNLHARNISQLRCVAAKQPKSAVPSSLGPVSSQSYANTAIYRDGNSNRVSKMVYIPSFTLLLAGNCRKQQLCATECRQLDSSCCSKPPACFLNQGDQQISSPAGLPQRLHTPTAS